MCSFEVDMVEDQQSSAGGTPENGCRETMNSNLNSGANTRPSKQYIAVVVSPGIVEFHIGPGDSESSALTLLHAPLRAGQHFLCIMEFEPVLHAMQQLAGKPGFISVVNPSSF
jgi:hypothetical protein